MLRWQVLEDTKSFDLSYRGPKTLWGNPTCEPSPRATRCCQPLQHTGDGYCGRPQMIHFDFYVALCRPRHARRGPRSHSTLDNVRVPHGSAFEAHPLQLLSRACVALRLLAALDGSFIRLVRLEDCFAISRTPTPDATLDFPCWLPSAHLGNAISFFNGRFKRSIDLRSARCDAPDTIGTKSAMRQKS